MRTSNTSLAMQLPLVLFFYFASKHVLVFGFFFTTLSQQKPMSQGHKGNEPWRPFESTLKWWGLSEKGVYLMLLEYFVFILSSAGAWVVEDPEGVTRCAFAHSPLPVERYQPIEPESNLMVIFTFLLAPVHVFIGPSHNTRAIQGSDRPIKTKHLIKSVINPPEVTSPRIPQPVTATACVYSTTDTERKRGRRRIGKNTEI